VGATVAAAALVLVGGGVAQAQDQPPDLEGPCSAEAVLSNGVVVDPARSSGVYVVPIEGSAQYTGSIDADVVVPRPISGEVTIVSPPGFPAITVSDAWVWDSPASVSLSSTGSVSWKLPKWLPRGVPITVEGIHRDAGLTCRGSVTIELEGSAFDSPLTYAAIAGTAVTGLGVAAAGVASARAAAAAAAAAGSSGAGSATGAGVAAGAAPPPPPPPSVVPPPTPPPTPPPPPGGPFTGGA
jgi:hypothetical protein